MVFFQDPLATQAGHIESIAGLPALGQVGLGLSQLLPALLELGEQLFAAIVVALGQLVQAGKCLGQAFLAGPPGLTSGLAGQKFGLLGRQELEQGLALGAIVGGEIA